MFRKLLVTFACFGALAVAAPGIADEQSDLSREEMRTDEFASNGEGNVVNRIAADFADTFGGKEEARNVILDLRDGTRPVKRDGTMGYGEIYIALSLAKAYAEANSITIEAALTKVLDLRADGAGWGNVAKAVDLRLGPVVSQMRSGNEKLAREIGRRDKKGADAERGDRGAKSDRPPRAERKQKPERPERPEKAERPEKPERPERAERLERPERPERPERVDRPEKPERPERASRK